jgi:hypothetical protein
VVPDEQLQQFGQLGDDLSQSFLVVLRCSCLYMLVERCSDLLVDLDESAEGFVVLVGGLFVEFGVGLRVLRGLLVLVAASGQHLVLSGEFACLALQSVELLLFLL